MEKKEKVNSNTSDEDRKKARVLAETRYWFRWHLVLYPIINTGLFVIWYLTGAMEFLWPLIPAGFWAVGLIAHYVIAYRSVGKSWIDKETETILQDLS